MSERPLNVEMDWCWIGIGENGWQVPFLTTDRAYVPSIMLWRDRQSHPRPFCDCGEEGCTGGLIAD